MKVKFIKFNNNGQSHKVFMDNGEIHNTMFDNVAKAMYAALKLNKDVTISVTDEYSNGLRYIKSYTF